MKNTKVTLLQVIILIVVVWVFATRLYGQIGEKTKPRILYTGALLAPSFSGASPLRGPNGERRAMPSRNIP